ncbi:hypothetical protein KQX54_009138 [Cotesia glomerata]|uniref:RIIa domain-containing protein n=1 Tax=Cotesia glomerata TaxID=32391 RepID=A0AAV7IFR5_COTGL|nr:hypothetical protein KQX54_009138 [Cotesia glomerata]
MSLKCEAYSSDDFPIFRKEDGRYLASSLGTPLIKGLTEVVHRRPKNPVTYLATYLNNFATHTNGNEYSSPDQERINCKLIPQSSVKWRMVTFVVRLKILIFQIYILFKSPFSIILRANCILHKLLTMLEQTNSRVDREVQQKSCSGSVNDSLRVLVEIQPVPGKNDQD